VRVAARIAVERDVAVKPTPAWEEVRAAAFRVADLSPQSPAHYLFPSRQVSLDPEIRDYAAQSFPPGGPALDGAIDLMNRIKKEFVYEVGAHTAPPHRRCPSRFGARLPGLLACDDFRHARARLAGRLYQRLSAHRAAR